jgi:hypothetical protein
MSTRSVRILAALWLLTCVGVYVYEVTTRLPKEFRTNVAYGIFGEYEGVGRGVVEIDLRRLDRIMDSLHRLPRGAMPCGYDYYLKIYRPNSSNIIISTNTECRYFTIHDTDGRTSLRNGVFYSLNGSFLRWIKRLASELTTSHDYFYSFQVPIALKFNELSAKIKQFKNGTILSPDSREGERNPYISLTYSDKLSTYPSLGVSQVMRYQCELGVLEPDNKFNLLINDQRLKGRIAEISPVRFRELRSFRGEETFFRELKLFITCALDKDDIEGLRASWEEVHGKGTFSYSADAEYDIEFITDGLLEKSDIVYLKERYGIQIIR